MKKKDIDRVNKLLEKEQAQSRYSADFYMRSDDDKKRVWLVIIIWKTADRLLNGEYNYSCTFPVDWLPPSQAYWFAGVLANDVNEAYKKGVADEHQRALQRGFASSWHQLKRALAHVTDPKREEDSQHG